MKNLWHAIVLFMLPGAILGGSSAWAFFRLADLDHEPLKILIAISVIWTFTAAIAASALIRVRHLSAAYYPAAVLTSAAFPAAVGACRVLDFPGWAAGLPCTVISAIAVPLFVQCFNSNYLKKRDRACFIAGVLLMGGFIFYAGFFNKLVWIETLLFYLSEALLLCWAFASPLTIYGKWQYRYPVRMILAAAAVGLFFLTPVFGYSAWSKAPPVMPDGLWQTTHITPQGSRFEWIAPNDRSGIFTPGGRLLAWDTPDEDLLPAIPGMLGAVNRDRPQVKLISNYNTILPKLFAERTGLQLDLKCVPGSLNDRLDKRPGKLRQTSAVVNIDTEDRSTQYDLLIISAWDENQYPGYIYRQWDALLQEMHENSIVVVRSDLLLNPAMFRVLNEQFPHSGILPGPCRLWVFSKHRIDLSIEVLDKNFCSRFNAVPGAYSMFCSNADIFQKQLPPPPGENLQLGSNRWFGSWLWLLPAAAAVLLWRCIRLPGERRNIMYLFWNSMENGFSGMGTLLLALGILITNCGIFTLTAAVLSLLTILIAVRWSAGKTTAALAGLLIMFLAAQGGFFWHFLLLPVIMQAMLFTGSVPQFEKFSARERRKIFAAIFIGMFFAAAAMAAIWLFAVPLMIAWALFFAARLPGIWQNNNMRVY